MENLFIEPIEQEKQAMVSVSEDSTKWVKEIIGSLLKSFPELPDTPLQIAYRYHFLYGGVPFVSGPPTTEEFGVFFLP